MHVDSSFGPGPPFECERTSQPDRPSPEQPATKGKREQEEKQKEENIIHAATQPQSRRQ